MVCVAGDDEDDAYSEEEEDSCGFLCALFDIWDEATDNYWDEHVNCDENGKTCIEKTDPAGESYATCGYDQDY